MRPLGIRYTLLICLALTVLSTLLGAAAVHAWQFDRNRREAEGLRVTALAEGYAAQAATLLLQSPRQAPNAQAISAWAHGLQWHPSSLLLAVIDADQQELAVRGPRSLLAPAERLISTTPTTPQAVMIDANFDQLLPNATLCVVPIRLEGESDARATLIYAARPANVPALPRRQMGLYCLRMACIAASGVLMGFAMLAHGVLRPLKLLAARGHGGDLPVERPDEIGALARTLDQMHMDLEEWRQRAVRLERSIQHRVDEETRRVNRELQQARRSSWTDALTGLGNRRMFEERYGQIFAAQSAGEHDLSVVMIDVDNFKPLNDTLGHAAGDELLRFIGELLRQGLREDDMAIRYGGDEFVLVLPGVSAAAARGIAERTIKLFAQQTRLINMTPRPSMSAGVSSLWEHHPASAEELLIMADQALYAAKGRGKAQVVVYQPERELAQAR